VPRRRSTRGAGASDYATKPTQSGSLAMSIDTIRKDLIPKIKAICGLTESAFPTPFRRSQEHGTGETHRNCGHWHIHGWA